MADADPPPAETDAAGRGRRDPGLLILYLAFLLFSPFAWLALGGWAWIATIALGTPAILIGWFLLRPDRD